MEAVHQQEDRQPHQEDPGWLIGLRLYCHSCTLLDGFARRQTIPHLPAEDLQMQLEVEIPAPNEVQLQIAMVTIHITLTSILRME